MGNILIADNPEGSKFVGFIHDFDYSSMEDDSDGGDTRVKSASTIDSHEVPEDLARMKEHTVCHVLNAFISYLGLIYCDNSGHLLLHGR